MCILHKTPSLVGWNPGLCNNNKKVGLITLARQIISVWPCCPASSTTLAAPSCDATTMPPFDSRADWFFSPLLAPFPFSVASPCWLPSSSEEEAEPAACRLTPPGVMLRRTRLPNNGRTVLATKSSSSTVAKGTCTGCVPDLKKGGQPASLQALTHRLPNKKSKPNKPNTAFPTKSPARSGRLLLYLSGTVATAMCRVVNALSSLREGFNPPKSLQALFLRDLGLMLIAGLAG